MVLMAGVRVEPCQELWKSIAWHLLSYQWRQQKYDPPCVVRDLTRAVNG